MDPEGIAGGYRAVVGLVGRTDVGRRARLKQLGPAEEQATQLSSLHTRNFM